MIIEKNEIFVQTHQLIDTFDLETFTISIIQYQDEQNL